jgi:hypothetical protein
MTSKRQPGVALYDYTGNAQLRQLSFKKGDKIVITTQYDNGWWAGEVNGQIGYVPATYVKLSAGAKAAPVPTNRPSRGRPAARGNRGTGNPRGTGNARAGYRPSNGMTRGTSPANRGPPRGRGRPSPRGRGGSTSPRSVPPSRGGSTRGTPKPRGGPRGPTRNVGATPPVKPQPRTPVSSIHSKSVVSNPPSVSRKTKPFGSKPTGSSGGGTNSAGGTVSEAEFEELDSLISRLQSDVLELKKLI